jgi:F-type H+-transporting ATPase subunit gamma
MREIRNRLKSIANTKQITESMRLISTRKVQKVRLRMAGNQPFSEQSADIVRTLVHDIRFNKHSYVVGRKTEKSLVILITGDRGLCGGYNTNAAKEAQSLMGTLEEAQIITIGVKGRDYFRRRRIQSVQSYRGISETPLYADAKDISEIVMKMYDDGSVDEVHLVFTEYQSMLTQTPKTTRLLPLVKAEDDTVHEIEYYSGDDDYIRNAVSSYVTSAIFGGMLESAVSEQCARVMSMDSAVKNADKMLEALRLNYNQLRQGAITQEIAEIVGGANVVGMKEG